MLYIYNRHISAFKVLVLLIEFHGKCFHYKYIFCFHPPTVDESNLLSGNRQYLSVT